ncbi:28588_t:CDS:1, partial [Gigaspora margarita]
VLFSVQFSTENENQNQNHFAKVELYEPKIVNEETIPLLSSSKLLTNKNQDTAL